MKLLQHILNGKNKLLPVGSCLFMSAIISGGACAETSKDGFPPIPEDEKTKAAATKKATPATNTVARKPAPAVKYQQPQQRYYYPQQAPRYYYPQQQMQGYRPSPYGYYYPQQQQMPNYAPRQWTYPQQRYNAPYQPYTQNQATPYRPYPVAPYQRPANYPQMPAYQKNQATNAATNNTASTGKKLYPMRKKIKKEKHAWGDERHIWPDFYTDATGNLWDKMINAPFDVGRMPGGWRAPSLSTPDPATVGDAVANQIPPIAEEMGNMTNFTN